MKQFKIMLVSNGSVIEKAYSKPMSELEAHHLMVQLRKHYNNLVDMYGIDNIADYAGADFAAFDEIVKGYGRVWVMIDMLDFPMPVAA